MYNKSKLSSDITDAIAAMETVEPATPQQQRPMLPLFSLAAGTLREAYPREGIIPATLWESIDPSALVAAVKSPEKLQARPF